MTKENRAYYFGTVLEGEKREYKVVLVLTFLNYLIHISFHLQNNAFRPEKTLIPSRRRKSKEISEMRYTLITSIIAALGFGYTPLTIPSMA
jgi:hypothetical protein